MKNIIKKLLREGLLDDIERIKDTTIKYGDLINFYKTPIGYKFVINKDMDLYDKKNEALYKIEISYVNPEYTVASQKSIWDIRKNYITQGGQEKTKLLISTNDANEVIKIIDKFAKYLIKNKV